MDRKEFYNSLSDELKEKIKACKSEEEMLKLLESENIELSQDILDGVAGGGLAPCFLHECREDCWCD